MARMNIEQQVGFVRRKANAAKVHLAARNNEVFLIERNVSEDYSGLPIHHNTLPTMRQPLLRPMLMESYFRFSETSTASRSIRSRRETVRPLVLCQATTTFPHSS